MSVFVGEGDLYEIRNYRTGRASFFEYDHAGRCMASTERAFTVSNGVIHYGAALSSYRYEYDVCNNLTKLTCSVAGATWNTVYTYDSDNRPKTTTTWSGTVLTNTYDSLGRLTKRTWGLGSSYETRLEYWLNGDNRTTLLHRYYNGNDDPYVYNYDNNGNIISITQGSTSISYTYDAANRLTRENNQVTNQTVTYEYDVWGNILNKKVYAYTTEQDPGTPIAPAVTYAYETGTNSWGDKLTSYDGQTITYDAMGNPLTYRGYTFGWRGKQLVSSVNGTQTISYEYNEDGLRQKKTVNGTETDYYYNGPVLIGMQRSGTRYLFSYDASGKVVSVKYNNNEYYYVRNGQGDIVKIIDAAGNPVVEYTYDTWGKKVTTTGSLAGTLGLIQPFRYRGYVYDYETGFYYLQSRYYDPTTGRFISADVFLSTGQGVLGHNAYAYCLDNPVNMHDPSGFASNTSDDNNENGIPDYLEEQWIELTNRCRARINGVVCRDVTDEVNSALEKATRRGRRTEFWLGVAEFFAPFIVDQICEGGELFIFYNLVNHEEPWDIKVKDSWENTIQTAYPGNPQTIVIYQGHYYTPEILGNYAYGALGKAYGIDLSLLFFGSMYAARFPEQGTNDYDNEMADWLFIANGYYSGH